METQSRPINEADLLLRAKSGDPEASEKLFVRYLSESTMIKSLLRRAVSDPEQRKDLLHEIYIQLITSHSTFRGDCSLSSYVYRVARVTIFQKFRRENTLKRGKIYRFIYPPMEKIEANDRENPEYIYELKQVRGIVNDIIARLPEDFREPVRLWMMEERTYAEIAAAIKEPVSAVAYRINKARQSLARYLTPLLRHCIDGAKI